MPETSAVQKEGYNMAEADQQQTGAPIADRPIMPEGYHVPADAEGMLPWSWAAERLSDAVTYWVGTVRPNGRPHAALVWGVWVGDCFYFSSAPDTRRSRNIATNPEVVVHIEHDDDIVIVEGRAAEIPDFTPALADRLVEAFAAKYEPKFHYRPDPAEWAGGGLYRVRPRLVMAWHEFPKSATRWRFHLEGGA
jgi:nitroimidazol reductase NimA-like FMN-containing flavoprotein (pyridoxamine 5'-phosphate oxidase superfamily)